MENLKVKELKVLAKERGIKGYYRMRKAELIEASSPGSTGSKGFSLSGISVGSTSMILYLISKESFKLLYKNLLAK